MELKKLIKKGFTVMELCIAMAVVSVLAATSVGLYFGLSKDPIEEETEKMNATVELWESFIASNNEYSDNLESRVHNFCTSYIDKSGLNVKLNYRVLEFDTYISAIPNETSRAYDPSANSKEAAIVKLESEYPSYFLTTLQSVLSISEPFLSEEEFNQSLIDNAYVSYSNILDDYSIALASDDFSRMFELSDITYNDKVVRGVRYVRYDILDHQDKHYKTVFFKANRTLNQECEGEYLPKSYSVIGSSGSMIYTSNFKLVEEKEDGNYYYDPNHLYEYPSTTHNETLMTYPSTDSSGASVNKTAPILISNHEYLTDSKTINFYPYIPGQSGGNGSNAGNNGGDINMGETPDIDIMNPIPDDEMPDGDISFDEDISVEDYPISLSFTNGFVPASSTFEKFWNWFKSLWGWVPDQEVKYLYFSTIDALNDFINSPEYLDLLETSSNEYSFLSFTNGLIIDSLLNIPNNFIVFVDNKIEMTNEQRNANIDEFVNNFSNNSITSMKRGDSLSEDNDYEYGRLDCEPFKVHYPAAPTKLVHITEDGVLKMTAKTRLYVEGDHYVTSWDYKNYSKSYGWSVKSYGEINNDGTIQLLGDAQMKVTGVISGSGRILTDSNSVVSEPFKITDYFGRKNMNKSYIERNIFPSDFYYLDSIRCQMSIVSGAKYVGMIAVQQMQDDVASFDHTYFGSFNIVASDLYTENTKAIFALSSGSNLIKSCNGPSGKSTFELVEGNLVYVSTVINTKESTYGPSTNSAYPEFNTKNTGFKLSNLDIIINDKTTFRMLSTDYNSGNSGYSKIEILPGSGITVRKGGQFIMGQNCFVFISNYFANDSYHFDRNSVNEVNSFNNIESRVKSSDNSNLIWPKVQKLYNIFHELKNSGQLNMFANYGHVEIDQTITSNITNTRTDNNCTAAIKCSWTIRYSNENYYTKSAIYASTANGLVYQGYELNYTHSGIDKSYKEHIIHKNDHEKIEIYNFKHNDYAYGYGGSTDCYFYPKYIAYFN